MQENQQGRETDVILDPFQYAYVLDRTKGSINVLVGPNKQSLSMTDQPVQFSEKTHKFEHCALDQSIQQFPSALEGWYMVLENPVSEVGKEHPGPGTANQMPELEYGRKINIPGPLIFPLWPGQIASVIEGHNLRSNQYLVVRVYDEQAAKENWAKAVVKKSITPIIPKDEEKGEGGESGEKEKEKENEGDVTPIIQTDAPKAPDLTTGQLLVIRGTDISFYMPPTGVEVLPNEDGDFIRNAVTLERLDYCILLDESGMKRYVRGPDVVFPEPTEAFLTSDGGKAYASDVRNKDRKPKGTRKFKAIELNENSGLYIKVIAPYEYHEKQYKEGDEIFITGKDQPIYFPREEHSVIKYGSEQVHYAVAIPSGEARYVLNRNTGEINLVKGPSMFLPDPRKEVVVRRVLPQKLVSLLYPGNIEALRHNQELEVLTGGVDIPEVTTSSSSRRAMAKMRSFHQYDEPVAYASALIGSPDLSEESADADFADDFERKQTHTPPRTITLDTKYDGAVAVNIWTGYAILAVNKRGGRTVHLGPKSVLLEYDETLELMELSSGKPKTTDDLVNTAYLRVRNNKISDIATAQTSDLVEVSLKLSYRVTFEGEDHEKWFSVENYVKFLCDHLRSLIRAAVKKVGVEEFNDTATELVRDTILGVSKEDKREGRLFTENNMRVYDVEILSVNVGDRVISDLLVETQHAVVRNALSIRQKEHELEMIRRSERINRETERERQQTALVINELAAESTESKLAVSLSNIDAEKQKELQKIEAKLAEQEDRDKLAVSELARARKSADQKLELQKAEIDQKLIEQKAETDAIVEKAKAIGPSFIEALNNLGDKEFAIKVAKEIAPLAIIRNTTTSEALTDLVQNLPRIGPLVQRMLSAANGNGTEEGSDD